MNVCKAMVRTLKKATIESFVIENVPQIVSHNGGKAWRKISTDVKKAGFSCTWKIFNSKDFGVPQIRRRVYLVGLKTSRGKVPNLPDPPMLQPPLLSEILDDDVGTATDLPDPNTVAGRSLRSFLHQLKNN